MRRFLNILSKTYTLHACKVNKYYMQKINNLQRLLKIHSKTFILYAYKIDKFDFSKTKYIFYDDVKRFKIKYCFICM